MRRRYCLEMALKVFGIALLGDSRLSHWSQVWNTIRARRE